MSPLPAEPTIEEAVRLAGRAPSLHNSQPWRWVFDGRSLHLFSVPGRMLSSTDHSGRQMLLSCGACLGHLRAALTARGWDTHVDYLPNPTRRDHLATVTCEPARFVTDADRERSAAIEHRHTDRLPFAPPPGWPDFGTVLEAIIDRDDAEITVLPDSARPELAHASRLTAALRRYDAGYQAELRWWTGHSLDKVGVPPAALISAEERERVDVGRVLPTVVAEPRRTDIETDHSVIIVLSTHGDSAAEVVRCGEALSTVLLECTVAGYATCPITHITELPRSRDIVRALTGLPDSTPQVLIRIGHAPDDAASRPSTPRLPLTDIFENRSGTS